VWNGVRVAEHATRFGKSCGFSLIQTIRKSSSFIAMASTWQMALAIALLLFR